MSNYPNMSYCAFENTVNALWQLRDMLSRAIDDGEPLEFSSRDEKQAYEELKETMEEIADLQQQHDDMFDEADGHEEDC